MKLQLRVKKMTQIDMTNDFIAQHTVDELATTPLSFKFKGKALARVWGWIN